MSYLKFDKAELVNLEYALPREILATNKRGGYLNTTIIGCNTRKYHGLFVLPLENFDNRKYILLSALDETLIQHGREFNLGIRCYGKEKYEPRGHKYIRDFEYDKSASITYGVGGMIFKKSVLFLPDKEQLLLKYTLLEAHSETLLRLRPFLAFREIHTLTHANDKADRGYMPVENGAAFKMYDGFPYVNIQINRFNEFIYEPLWYYNVNYQEEQRRGFEYKEDLFNPGYFELPIKKNDTVIVSVSTSSVSSRGLTRVYNNAEKNIKSLNSYNDCLRLAAKQFIVNGKDGMKEIYMGYTWLGKSLRETLISLSGLTLFNDGDIATFNAVLESTYKIYDRQLMNGSKQVEAGLWLFWVAQQYAKFIGDERAAWLKFRTKLKAVAESFASGSRMGVTLAENGMLWAKMKGVAMSWMNAYDDDGDPITERGGFQVEVNAFWYNAVAYLAEMESKYDNNNASSSKWEDIKRKIENNFYNLFWVDKYQYLADYVDEKGQNQFTRPNQIFACALDYSPISEEAREKVMENVRKELLTTRGIRTLSPKNPFYKGVYDGNQYQRDHAYHQGSTRVWLLSFYIEAFLKLHEEAFVPKAEELINAFEEDINIHGVGLVCELYDGDPPHNPHGAISSSVVIAGLLRARYLINQYKKGKP